MTRVDLFVNVHKGLRAALFEAAALAARTDFTQHRETEVALVRVRRALGFLREHAEHEDRFLLPVVAAHCPSLAAGFRREHSQTAHMEAELESLMERLPATPPAGRTALGRRLLTQLNLLIAEHLTHMEREETEASRVLWAHCTDEELDALHGAILASIEPLRLAEWIELILPALSGPEREKAQAQVAAQGHA